MISKTFRAPSVLPLLTILGTLAAGYVHAITYEWLATGSNQQWLNLANYNTATPGTISPTSADTFIYDSGTRTANIQANGTIGRIEVGANYAPSSNNIGTGSSAVLTIQSGGGVTTPGIEVRSGRTTNININARLNLQGDITITNNGTSRLRLGASAGEGGLQGTGTLAIKGGVVLLEEPTNAHSYSGAVTVNGNGTLQISSGTTFSTYSSLMVGSSGALAGAGTVAGATIQGGGRVSPGGDGGVAASPATLTFTNLLNLQSTGLAVLDIRATGNDAINATAGSITLGGELRLRLNTDYTTQGTHQLFLGLGVSSGNFNSVNIQTGGVTASSVGLTDDGNGLWTGEFTERGYDVSFDANSGLLTLTQIPEPTHLLLSSLGVITLLRRRR